MKDSVYTNRFGVMQGRLLRKWRGRYQAHPVGYWDEEFPLARQLELNLIEFILDYNDVEKNPLMLPTGLEELSKLMKRTGVFVKTVCADYFMEAPLHSDRAEVVEESVLVLQRLIDSLKKIGGTDIVIPCVDQSSFNRFRGGLERFVSVLNSVLPGAAKAGINLSLETDLDPENFSRLIDRFKSDYIKVNYDTGNSASLGYNPVEEFAAYGDRISDVHIKDRTYNGGSVLLGQGDANFDLIFSLLKSTAYRGPIIMQAYRDDEGLQVFKQQLEFIQPYLKSLSNES